MNRFDERYVFRMAEELDIPQIMEYFKNLWNAQHIFALSEELLRYEFLNNSFLNIILAIDKKHLSIEGLWAFYPFSKDEMNCDIGGGPWSVRQSVENLPFLGVELLRRSQKMINCRACIGVGDNPQTSGIYHRKIGKEEVGVLEHYYRLGNVKQYYIAKINQYKKIPVMEEKPMANLVRFDSIEELTKRFCFEKYKDSIPYKDDWYYNKRFFHHIKYKYNVYGIERNHVITALMVIKAVCQNGGAVLRIVDYFGDRSSIRYVGDALDSMLSDKYEYIDFYCHGMKQKDLEKAGFCLRTEDDENVIPNYFEPFVQENIGIGYSSTHRDSLICKADGDQDRPNYLYKEKERDLLC